GARTTPQSSETVAGVSSNVAMGAPIPPRPFAHRAGLHPVVLRQCESTALRLTRNRRPNWRIKRHCTSKTTQKDTQNQYWILQLALLKGVRRDLHVLQIILR